MPVLLPAIRNFSKGIKTFLSLSLMIFPIESYYTENNTIRLTQDG
jgi:hypothetical protein